MGLLEAFLNWLRRESRAVDTESLCVLAGKMVCLFALIFTFWTMEDAAIVMLSGQVADGFATIFIGELIDRFRHFKIWHAAGSTLVAISFSSIFGGCLPCSILHANSLTIETLSYIMFAAIFNRGWAATQVSHMAMVNCITLNSTRRVALTSSRNAFSMVANLGLYAIALVVFGVSKADTKENTKTQLMPMAIYAQSKNQEKKAWTRV